jgi:hypothetical protein
MAIATRDDLISGLAANSERVIWNKASITTQVSGGWSSLWKATGTPAPGINPTTAQYCTSALTGGIGFTNQTDPVTTYIGYHTLMTGNANTNLEIHDRLAHIGGLVGNITTSQACAIDLSTINAGGAVPAARLGASDYSDVTWWLEWYTATGATASNATVNVTYSDGSTGNLTAVAVGGTAMAASRMIMLNPLNTTTLAIRGVNTVILSATTGTAGVFGVTATKARCAMSTGAIANVQTAFDWAQLGLPQVANDACLFGVMMATATSTGTIMGQGKLVHK